MRSFFLFTIGVFSISCAVYLGLGLYDNDSQTAKAMAPKKIWLATTTKHYAKNDFLDVTDIDWVFVQQKESHEEFLNKQTPAVAKFLVTKDLEAGQLLKSADLVSIDMPSIAKRALREGFELVDFPSRIKNGALSRYSQGDRLNIFWIYKKPNSTKEEVLQIGREWRVLFNGEVPYLEIPKSYIPLFLSLQNLGRFEFLNVTNHSKTTIQATAKELQNQISDLLENTTVPTKTTSEIRIHRGNVVSKIPQSESAANSIFVDKRDRGAE